MSCSHPDPGLLNRTLKEYLLTTTPRSNTIMIIRTPTRTKTSSFNGPQMSFKFPSTESLPQANLDEFHMSNHYLLNSNHKSTESDEAASQILSDYTSASNTGTNSGNSSNGYYSFANISDNTTASPKVYTSRSSSHQLDHSTTPLLEPHSQENDQGLSGASPKAASPMEAIPENAFTSNSTIFDSIPTADNYSYKITSPASSAKSVRSRKSSIVRKNVVAKLQHIPSIAQVDSSDSLESADVDSLKSRPASRLKRSKAVRCRGGLLQYFILLGLKLKKQLRKVIYGIRQKLFKGKKRDQSASSYSTAPGKKLPKSAKLKSTLQSKRLGSRSSSNDHPTTSHLKRTQHYVNNLQRSMSYKSLQPVLMENDGSKKSVVREAQVEQVPNAKDARRNPTTSLRRTNSSIRRAASVIKTKASSDQQPPPENVESTLDDASHLNKASVKQEQGVVTSLTRSAGSRSLSSIARQPSIVVKNKVIPLSVHPYSIEEEDEDDEYVISTDEMRPLSPTATDSSDEESYEDAEDFVYKADFKGLLAERLNQYLSSVIAQRIMLRLQIVKHQETGANNSYVDLMESIIKEYEAPSTAESVHASSDIESEALPCSVIPEKSPNSQSNLQFRIQSAFNKGGSRLKHSNSFISLSAQTVKRSLTLPVGIKV